VLRVAVVVLLLPIAAGIGGVYLINQRQCAVGRASELVLRVNQQKPGRVGDLLAAVEYREGDILYEFPRAGVKQPA